MAELQRLDPWAAEYVEEEEPSLEELQRLAYQMPGELQVAQRVAYEAPITEQLQRIQPLLDVGAQVQEIAGEFQRGAEWQEQERIAGEMGMTTDEYQEYLGESGRAIAPTGEIQRIQPLTGAPSRPRPRGVGVGDGIPRTPLEPPVPPGMPTPVEVAQGLGARAEDVAVGAGRGLAVAAESPTGRALRKGLEMAEQEALAPVAGRLVKLGTALGFRPGEWEFQKPSAKRFAEVFTMSTEEAREFLREQPMATQILSEAAIPLFGAEARNVREALKLAARGGRLTAEQARQTVVKAAPRLREALIHGEEGGFRAPRPLRESVERAVGRAAPEQPVLEEEVVDLVGLALERAQRTGYLPLWARHDPTAKLATALYATRRMEPAFAQALREKRRGMAGAMQAIRRRAMRGDPEKAEDFVRMAEAQRRGATAADLGLTEDFITAQEMNELVYAITLSPKVTPLEWPRAVRSLQTLLMEGKRIPKNERALLRKAFGDKFGDAMEKMMEDPMAMKVWREAVGLWNAPRALVASFDLSFPLRQGAMMISRPGFYKAWGPMMRAAADRETANGFVRNILESPLWVEWGERSGLAIADPTGEWHQLGRPFEEAFISKWAQKLPGIQHSQRAYTTAGNQMRWDYFRTTIGNWDRLGRQYKDSDVRALARWINIATGWGELGPMEHILPELAAVLFSPRFWAARLQALPYGTYLAVTNPFLRREVIRDLTSFVGTNVGLLAFMKYGVIPNVDVELDPRSTDWGRIRVGPVRIDPWAGFQPTIRVIAQLATGKGKSTVSGEFYSKKWQRTAATYFRGKLQPMASVVGDVWTGTTFVGEPLGLDENTAEAEVWNRLVPMVAQDMWEGWKEAGITGAALGSVGVFGVGFLAYRTPWQKKLQAYEAASQERLGTSYQEAVESHEGGRRYINSLLDDHPDVVAADEEIEKRRDWYGGEGAAWSMERLLDPFHEAQLTDDKEIIPNGPWREAQSGRNKAKSAAIAGFYHANPEQRERMLDERDDIGDPYEIPEEWTPDDIADRFLAIMTDHTDVATGAVDDRDALQEDLDRFETILSPEQQEALDRNLGLKATPRQQAYRAAMRYVARPRMRLNDEDVGFFDLRGALYEMAQGKDPWLAQYPTYNDLRTVILRDKPADQTENQALNNLAKRHTGLAWFLDRYSSNTDESYLDQYRRKYPAVDAWLVFYNIRGYETVLSEEARAYWRKSINEEPPRLRD